MTIIEYDFINEVDMDLSIYFYVQNVQADQTIGETNNYCYTRTNFEMTATFKGTSNTKDVHPSIPHKGNHGTSLIAGPEYTE